MVKPGILYGEEKQEETACSTLVSRNITVRGRRTSVRLEPEMWTALRDIATREHCRIHDICSLIDLRKRTHTSLTAAIRVFLMLYYRAASTEEGHLRARHGNFRNMLERAGVEQEQVRSHETGVILPSIRTVEASHAPN